MRRPFHWILLSIPLAIFHTRGEPAPVAISDQPSPFAYVRQDGTEVYVRYAGSAMPHPEMTEEDVLVTSDLGTGSDLRAAVYTWSTPVTATTSGWTSSP